MTTMRVHVGSPTTLATDVTVPASCGLLAFCPSLRAVAFSTGGGVEMALTSASTDELIPGSRVAVPLGAAGGVDAAQVTALQWCGSGMSRGSAVLVAMDPRGAACGVVRLSEDGARLVLEGVKAVAVERPAAGAALRQMQASPSHPAVALLSPASVCVAGLPGGDVLAHRAVPASSSTLTACQWLDAEAWGAPGGAAMVRNEGSPMRRNAKHECLPIRSPRSTRSPTKKKNIFHLQKASTTIHKRTPYGKR